MKTTDDINSSELDDIKAGWDAMRLNAEKVNSENARLTRDLTLNRIHSKYSRLRKINIMKSASCFALILFVPFLLELFPKMAVIGYVYGATSAVLGLLNIYFTVYVSNRDINNLPVIQAEEALLQIKKRHSQIRLSSILVTVPLMILLGIGFYRLGDVALSIAALLGLIIGTTFGIIIYVRISRMLKSMSDQLHNITEGGE